MNSLTLYLTGAVDTYSYYLSGKTLTDITMINLVLSSLPFDETHLPFKLTVNWGDGSATDTQKAHYFNLSSAILSATKPDILTNVAQHLYHPSDTTTMRALTCEVTIDYINNKQYYYNIPIQITSPSFQEKIGDITLLQTSIINYTNMLYVFGTAVDNNVIETVLVKPKNY